MTPIRVLLVDDHQLFREGLANILNNQPDFQVVAEAGDGLEAQIKARKLEPDLILMRQDLHIERAHPVECVEALPGA